VPLGTVALQHNGGEGGRHGIEMDGIVLASRQRSRLGVDGSGGEVGADGASEDVVKDGMSLRRREPPRCRGSGG
jgi:hypothetical protein